MFFSQQNNPETIRKSYVDIEGQPHKIKEELVIVDNQIQSAKLGGCVRRPMSIMGPNPDLEQHYILRKSILEKMLKETDVNLNQPKNC